MWQHISRYLNRHLKIILVLTGLLGVILIVLSDYLSVVFGFSIENVTFTDKLLGSLYFLTLVVLFWYAGETAKLRKVSVANLRITNAALKEQQQNAVLALKPLIIVVKAMKEYIEIRNVGNGPALNIDIVGSLYDESVKVRLKVVAGLTNDVDWVERVEPRSSIDKALYEKIWNSTSIHFCIRFEDMLGREYRSHCESDSNPERGFRFNSRTLHRCI